MSSPSNLSIVGQTLIPATFHETSSRQMWPVQDFFWKWELGIVYNNIDIVFDIWISTISFILSHLCGLLFLTLFNVATIWKWSLIRFTLPNRRLLSDLANSLTVKTVLDVSAHVRAHARCKHQQHFLSENSSDLKDQAILLRRASSGSEWFSFIFFYPHSSFWPF